MKNKVCYILLCLLVSFAFINSVFAEGITISAVANSTEVVKGEKVSILIKLTADEVISSCQFKLENDENIVFDSTVSLITGWVPTETSAESITVTNSSSSTELPSDTGILQANYTINGSGKVTIKTEQCISTVDNKVYNYDDITINFTAVDPVDDTTLKSLTITGGEAIVFDPNKSDYAVKLTSPNFSLSMTASNEDYQDDIVVKDDDGTVLDPTNIAFKDLSDGQNMMTLYISVNGKQMYELATSYKQENLDNSLSSIKINDSDLALEEGKLEYTVEVESDVTSVLIEATVKDSENFQISKDSNIFSGAFNVVDTEYAVIVVEPKDPQVGAESKTYTITIKRRNSDNSTGNTGNNDDDKSDNNNNSSNNTGVDKDGNVTENQNTGDISMFIMAFILLASLVGSVILYQKNLESYR